MPSNAVSIRVVAFLALELPLKIIKNRPKILSTNPQPLGITEGLFLKQL